MPVRPFFLFLMAVLCLSSCAAVRRAADHTPDAGDMQILMSPPLFNVYNLSLGKQIQAATPTIGTTLGAVYWYRQAHAVSFTVGGAMAFTPYCPDGCRLNDTMQLVTGTKQSVSFISLQHHHMLGRFDLGYGIYAGHRKWQIHKTDFDDIEQVVQKEHYTGLGPVLSLRYRILSFFYGGFEYQPQVWQLSGGSPAGYSHMLNIGFQFTLPIIHR